MSYTHGKETFSFDIKTADMAGAISDNTDLFSIIIPANREIQVQNMNADVRLASDGADFIELCKEDNTVIAKVALQTTGLKSAVQSDGSTAQTFPQTVAPQSTTALSKLKLRSDGATDTSTDVTIQVEISGRR
jgi:hypothetical protein